MTLLQVSIGALNDIVDAPDDAGHKPGKPIPAGLVTRSAGWVVVAVGGGAGLALALVTGLATGILAGLVLAIGYAYDLKFKGTAWSWLPFAIGIPLLPVFGWLGATGVVPPGFAVLVPVAFVAGAGLAIANARADLDRDTAAGVDSVAVRLGLQRSWVFHVVLLAFVVAAAVMTHQASAAALAPVLGALGAGAVIAIGALLGRGASSARRERAWELEAVGVALLAVAWLNGVPLAG
jgi:geranylgeranylglycerol-phosphate geranylgeranyltransferase